MIRILHIGLSYECGGIENFVMNYYRFIDRSKVQFDFINPYCAPLAYEAEMKELGARIFIVPDFHSNPLKYMQELKNIIKEYSVVHVHMLSAANLIPIKIAKKCGVRKIIAHSHNTFSEGLLRTVLHYINFRKIKNIATDFFSCSEKAGVWMFGKNQCFIIIKNAININKYKFKRDVRIEMREQLGFPENAIVYGNIGRLNIQKNQLFLIDIFSKIHVIQKNSFLCIVGDGELKGVIQQKINKLGLNSCVRLLGVRNDVEKIYNALDVIIMPSIFEGLPISLVESQANGLKCFASKSCIPDESKILDSLEFINLNESSDNWARRITTSNICRDSNAINILTHNRYNIIEEAERLLYCYLN